MKLEILIAFSAIGLSNGDCVWYGKCGVNTPDKGGLPLNCQYDGQPKPVTSPSSLAILEEVCPHLFPEDDKDHTQVDLCCDDFNIKSMREDLNQIIGFFSRCPQCLYNFYRFICDTTCSRNQSDFMKVVKTVDYFDPFTFTVKPAITEINYHLSDDFAYGQYNSCNTVLFPSTGQPVVQVMCENAQLSYCNVSGFYQATGQDYIAQVPFQMNHCFSGNDLKGECDTYKPDNNFVPYNPPVFECFNPMEDVYYWDDEPSCSCADCKNVCPVKAAVEPVEKCTIDGFDCIFYYSMIAAGAVTGVLIVIFFIITCMKKETDEKSPKEKPSNRQRAAYDLEQFLAKIFYKWGYFCATNAVMVLIIGLLVCLIFILGILLINRPPITDPVELWAAPTSNTKLQKDYFDQHFGPFYRTTQLIVRPLNYNLDELVYNGLCDVDDGEPLGDIGDPDDSIVVSGLFRKSFLDAVFQLQLDIMDLKAEYDGEQVNLKDICFKPLYPDYDECTVTSIFNYFQNDPKKFAEWTCPNDPNLFFAPVDTYYAKLETCLL